MAANQQAFFSGCCLPSETTLPIKWIAARVQIGTAKGAKSGLPHLTQSQDQRKTASALEPCAQIEFQSAVFCCANRELDRGTLRAILWQTDIGVEDFSLETAFQTTKYILLDRPIFGALLAGNGRTLELPNAPVLIMLRALPAG